MAGEQEGGLVEEVLEAVGVALVAGQVAPLGGEAVAPAEEQTLGAGAGEVEAVRLGRGTQLLQGDTQAIRHQ